MRNLRKSNILAEEYIKLIGIIYFSLVLLIFSDQFIECQ